MHQIHYNISISCHLNDGNMLSISKQYAITKEVKSNPKHPIEEGHCEKRFEIQVGSQEMAVMVG